MHRPPFAHVLYAMSIDPSLLKTGAPGLVALNETTSYLISQGPFNDLENASEMPLLQFSLAPALRYVVLVVAVAVAALVVLLLLLLPHTVGGPHVEGGRGTLQFLTAAPVHLWFVKYSNHVPSGACATTGLPAACGTAMSASVHGPSGLVEVACLQRLDAVYSANQ
jgi:hypothetical protein